MEQALGLRSSFGDAIRVRDLRVDYGDFTAVRDLTLTVKAGEIFGLVGPNGAGKTSTFKVLATLLQPTYGDVILCGLDIMERSREVKRLIGYMPDLAPVPSDLYAWEFLDYYALAYGHFATRSARRAAVDEAIEEVQLCEQRKAKCKALSRGQTQRLVLAKIILQRAQLLILDEPASGLDPLSRKNLKQTLKRLTNNGATIIISSHILSELSEICTSLGILNQGELLTQGTADKIEEEFGSAERTLAFRFLERKKEAAAWLERHPQVTHMEIGENRVRCDFTGDDVAQAELLAGLIDAGFQLRTVEETHNTFEEILSRIAESNQ